MIRRSGENIAAAEVESVLRQHPLVGDVACAAVPDDLRGEEVLACIVPREAIADDAGAAQASSRTRCANSPTSRRLGMSLSSPSCR